MNRSASGYSFTDMTVHEYHNVRNVRTIRSHGMAFTKTSENHKRNKITVMKTTINKKMRLAHLLPLYATSGHPVNLTPSDRQSLQMYWP